MAMSSPGVSPASFRRGGKPAWWAELTSGGRELPHSVKERIRWYNGYVGRQRVGFYALEGMVIVTSATIPAVAAVGAPNAVAGVLGAAVTGLVSLRQLLRARENWVRCSATLMVLQSEAVAWSVGAPPYDNPNTADATLATKVEHIVIHETTQWTALRGHEGDEDGKSREDKAAAEE